jgi:hypothetical protein
MKTNRWTALGIALSFNLITLSAVNPQAAIPAAPVATTPTQAAAASVPPAPLSKATVEKIARMTSLFDGKSLDGWIQAPPYASTFSGDDIANLPNLAKRLTAKSDAVSVFVSNQLDEALKTDLATFSAASTNARTVKSALAKNLTRIVSGVPIYDKAGFQKVQLRPETDQLRQQNPSGEKLERLNRMLLEDAYPMELPASPAASWTVKDGAMSSLGAGRGVIYTKGEYGNFRLLFTIRHVSGQPDHQACILIFCTTPPEGQKGLDALAGIQFQPPNGGSWDYRPGKNNSGQGLFTRLPHPKFDAHEWSQVELLVNAEKGTARMAVAQPVGTKAVEVLNFNDPTAGKKGPIAWQMHNKGLFDEYKDVRIEVNPAEDKLISVE